MKRYDSIDDFKRDSGISQNVFIIEIDILSQFTSKGDSAYNVAVKNGFEGTEQEWLQSLKQPALDAAKKVDDLLNNVPDNIGAELEKKADKVVVNAHLSDFNNPHKVTKEQIGLGNVSNIAPDEMPVSNQVRLELDKKYDKTGGLISGDVSVLGNVVADGDIVAGASESFIFTSSSKTGGAAYLYELLDVDIPDPINNQVLSYNAISAKWVSRALTSSDVDALPSNWRPTWEDIKNKPRAFTPTTHTQQISTITGLQEELDNKQPKGNYEIAFVKNTAFNKNFGSAIGTVCEGNDPRLSDSRPASDVYEWAKQPTKPTYNKSEVGLENVDNTSDADKPISNATQAALNRKAEKNGDSSEDFYVKNLNAKGNGLFSGDIVALKSGSTVFTANNVSGGSQYLYELLDVDILDPQNGDILVFNAENQMWCNYSEIIFDGGTYAII